MAIATIPAVASPVKSVQRGSAGGAGSVTITAVDISKSMVNIQGTAASGTVAAAGAINAANASFTATRMRTFTGYFSSFNVGNGGTDAGGNTNLWMPTMTVPINATNLSGGSTNIVAAQVTGFLANSTTLTVSAACRYEVVEFN